MGYNGVSNKRLPSKTLRPPVFMDEQQPTRSASMGTSNLAGSDYVEVPAGTVMARCGDSLHRPLALDALQTAASSDTTLDVENAYQFRVGDYVYVAGAALPVKITAVDYDANTITVDAAQTEAIGATLEVDPSKQVSPAVGAGSSVNTVTVPTDEGALFRVGKSITIDGVAGARTITDITGDVITFDGAAGSYSDGALVIQASYGDYKILVGTVQMDHGHGFVSDNVLGPYRTHGEARKDVVLGLTTAAEAALSPMVEFKSIHS